MWSYWLTAWTHAGKPQLPSLIQHRGTLLLLQPERIASLPKRAEWHLPLSKSPSRRLRARWRLANAWS